MSGTTLAPGAAVGAYRLGRLLGRGGMGQVFEATDTRGGVRVALKVLLGGADPALHERFLREARLMQRVRHPNVVGILEVGWHEGAPFMALEFIDGQSLDALARGPMEWQPAMRLTFALLQGLGAIHAARVVHRDLKPANVMVDRAGVPRWVDFGISRSLTAEEQKYTSTGMLIGTPAYMAREQLFGQPLDERTDLYAVGVMLHELLTGEVPFGDRTLEGAWRRVRDRIPALSSAGSVPPALSDLVLALLSPEPSGRPASVSDVVRRFREIAATPWRPSPAKLEDTLVREPRLEATLLKEQPSLDEEPERARVALVARVPPSVLQRPAERSLLAGLVKRGRSFSYARQFWCALFVATNDADAQTAAAHAAAELTARFGAHTSVLSGPIGAGFLLSPLAVSGAAPLPAELQALIDAVTEARP